MIGQAALILVFFFTVLAIFVNQDVIRSRMLRFLDIPYQWAPVAGTFALFALGVIGFEQILAGITGSAGVGGFKLIGSGPLSTLILFLSVAFVSLCLEVSGFFRYLAVEILKVVDGSGRKLFFAVFWVSGVLALFTSNDILILTFTPFLIEFLDLAELNAVPYLVAEFFAANIFSMVFLIGNETNIIVSTAHNLGFLSFAEYMILPGLVGGIAGFGALYLIFRDSLENSYEVRELPDVRINRWEVLASFLLVGTLLSLAVFSMLGFQLWSIGLLWAAISFVLFVLPDVLEKCAERADAEELFIYRINRKMPWEVIPFLLGFFVLVHAFSISGLTASLTDLLSSLAGGSLHETVFGVGVLSTLSANLLNNIPMTVLMTDVLAGYGTGTGQTAALYSLVIGSNIGANLTPIGALAGIMWMKMLNHEEERITFREFFSIGWKVTLATAPASLLVLYLVMVI